MLEEDTFQIDNNENDHSNFEGGRCGICMDIIIDRGVLDCCQHWFCFACIDNWSTITNLCPLCQGEFQLITCVPVYDTIGSSNVDEDTFSRDNDWFIEGKSNTLSFPSYYIDENAVICLDGDGCQIRSGSATVEGDSNLDTSIACDSCDIWYHAFCVGFDAEGTSEDTWLCPRCAGEVPQNSAVNLIKSTNDQCGLTSVESECLAEAGISRKVSVCVADAGETAVVVSAVGGNQWTEEPNECFQSEREVDNGLGSETIIPIANGPKADSRLSGRISISPMLEAHELELSLLHDTSSSLPSNSLGHTELKMGCADKKVNEQSCSDGIKNSLRKSFNEFYTGKKLFESESGISLHLGLSVGSFLSVDDETNDVTENQITRDMQLQNPLKESLPKADEIEPGASEDASPITGVKRNHTDCSDDACWSGDHNESKAKDSEVSAKKFRAEGEAQMTLVKEEANTSISEDSQKSSSLIVGPQDDKSKPSPEKEDITSIMSIVKGTTLRSPKGLAQQNSSDNFLKEKENVSGLRVKKIMKRAAEDKDVSVMVEELRKKIREAVRNKSSKDIGENLFDPKLLAAFRTAVSGPKTEPVKQLSPLSVKVKKSMLEKGKVRENLTKKIYGNSNGRRRRAWDRDCEVEFWKYRCMRATKPEKIETLKSVLNLLRKNSETSDVKQVTDCQAANPILSRLYLADTSVFPRKDNIKPLSALKGTGNNDQRAGQTMPIEKDPKLSLDRCTSKVIEKGKVSSKVGIPSLVERGTRNSLSSIKSDASSSKMYLNGRPKGSSVSPLGDSTVNSKNDMTVKPNNVKMDKRKWALEILARKTAVAGKSGTHEKQEDNALLKGKYPLLAQLPIEMRPALASSRHNKIPISVRQTQLYRLTECFLRKSNLPVICRTAETELAVADAINIEREIADRSNSKVVYLNLCSQEILHRSDNKKSITATESNSSSPFAVPVDESEESTDKASADPMVEEALRNAGLLSDSPPNSPHQPIEVQNEVDVSSMDTKDEGPDNIFEINSHPEVDIYGDFDYDLEDEDYIGASAVKVAKVQPEEVVSKMKVVFSTLNSENSNNLIGLKDDGGWGKNEVDKDSGRTDAGMRNSTTESVTVGSCVPPESLPIEDGEDPSLTECEELYGPDKEPFDNKFHGESQKQDGLINGEAPAKNKCAGEIQAENMTVGTSSHHSSGIGKSPNQFHPNDMIMRKETTSNTGDDKQGDSGNVVYKKVEAYIKEHIRPLCKSGVITVEQYRWAVAKTTDKVMKYHINAKNANFLIKEGEKVKKLAEQYVEAAQQKG